MCVGTFGIRDNANSAFPIGNQIYVCRHNWHCIKCQLFIPYSVPNLCVSAQLAFDTMPIVQSHLTPYLFIKDRCVNAIFQVDNANCAFPIGNQIYVFRHNWY